MSRPQPHRPDRSNEHTDGSSLRRSTRTTIAVRNGFGVPAIRDIEQDNLAARFRGSTSQLVKAADDEQVGFETARRRGDCSAKSKDGEVVMWGFNDLGVLASANPPRHHHRLCVDVLQTVGLHRLDRPLNRAGQIG
jgi:hypothetical protein